MSNAVYVNIWNKLELDLLTELGVWALVEKLLSAPGTASYTPYHSQYWGHLLSDRGDAEQAISRSVASAKVDMNPHQVESATFAIQSPLSKGAILADEVGLGKTIEASLVIAQRWAERRRNILLIVPASLRKQWSQELLEKFSLSSEILESKTFNQMLKAKSGNPFDQQDKIVICSYQFAAKKSAEISAIPWDLVVFDEAHKLRNVYKKDGSKIAKTITETLRERNKILLSATPLQNSLMELYGLVSVIDPHFFGSELSFKQQFVSGKVQDQQFITLKQRLKSICSRTLRRQVQSEGGINFTKRLSLTQDFTPSKSEQDLYEKVSAFLQRDGLAAIAKGNKTLVTLVIRKILASSSFAIAGTLQKMIDRLESKFGIDSEALADFDIADEIAEELDDDDKTDNAIDTAAVKAEIAELKSYQQLAKGIQDNAKGQALVTALEIAFKKASELGGKRKAVIFTESCRTQLYLKELLESNGYEGEIIILNGSNSDPHSVEIYKEWVEKHKGTDAISGSKTSDMKAAVVDAFRNSKSILIATESGAEGINLQFCSLVINYDLPWNPQRVEQRIGRCHRYGQKYDVVVLNFINKGNRADERVFQLLDQKFQLFEGVFGASDEILGAIESGVDIEQRILQVFQNCRTPQEIEDSFANLQNQLDESIQARESSARQMLLENFDENVHKVLRTRRDKITESLSEMQKLLFNLAKAELGTQGKFGDRSFTYKNATYYLDWRQSEEKSGKFFRLNDAGLADELIEKALQRQLPGGTVEFHYDRYGMQLSDLKPFRGKQGWLSLKKLTVDSIQTVDQLILSCIADDGEVLDPQQCHRLLSIPGIQSGQELTSLPVDLIDRLDQHQISTFVDLASQRNNQYFDEESDKLDRWADESKEALLREIKEIDAEIKAAKKEARQLPLADKVAAQKKIKAMETKRDKRQLDYFESRKKIEAQQEKLLDDVQAKLELKYGVEPVFAIRWKLA